MTEQEAQDLRVIAWHINRLCAVAGYWTQNEDTREAVQQAREGAARLREMAGDRPKCNGNGG